MLSPTYLRPVLDARAGGERPTEGSCENCRAPCERSRFEFWHDYTVHLPIPDPLCEEAPELCPGICELRSALIRLQSCKSWAIPPDHSCMCSSWTTLADVAVAVMGNVHPLRCGKDAFKPFHRAGVGSTISAHEAEHFRHPERPTTGYRVYAMFGEFVSNSRPADMTISGPDWMSLDEGYLVGSTPVIGEPRRYQWTVTARNSVGSDSTTLTIEVEP